MYLCNQIFLNTCPHAASYTGSWGSSQQESAERSNSWIGHSPWSRSLMGERNGNPRQGGWEKVSETRTVRLHGSVVWRLQMWEAFLLFGGRIWGVPFLLVPKTVALVFATVVFLIHINFGFIETHCFSSLESRVSLPNSDCWLASRWGCAFHSEEWMFLGLHVLLTLLVRAFLTWENSPLGGLQAAMYLCALVVVRSGSAWWKPAAFLVKGRKTVERVASVW